MAIWENILIFSRKVETWKLDGMFQRGWRTHNNEKVNEIRGRKGFAVNKDSKTASKTAESWSNAVPVLRQTARSRIAMLFDDEDEIVEERPNTPMKNLKVFHLEHRGQGGRAYKVLDEDGYVWDMREDVLLEAMITVGISPGGTIGGEWVWGNVGSQGKLIRVGSKLYEEQAKTSKRLKQKKIGVRDLVPGGVYKTASGSVGVFYGFAHAEGKKKLQVWFEAHMWGEGATEVEKAQRCILERRDSIYYWKVLGNSSYVEKIGDIDISRVPEPCARLRQTATSNLRNAHTEWNRRQSERWYSSSYGTFREYMTSYYGRKDTRRNISLYPLDTPIEPPAPEVQALLDQIA